MSWSSMTIRTLSLRWALIEPLPVMSRWLDGLSLRFPRDGIIADPHGLRAPGSATCAVSHGRHRLAAAFGTLALSFWPYMIPFSITIEDAAAPHSSQAFMFWGAGLFVFPLMLLFTATNTACSEAGFGRTPITTIDNN